jgi:hypothetical protein
MPPARAIRECSAPGDGDDRGRRARRAQAGRPARLPCDVLRAATKALADLRDIHAGFDETHDPALDGACALHDGGPSQETPTLLVMSAARLEIARVGNLPGPNRARSDRRPVTRHGPATWREHGSSLDGSLPSVGSYAILPLLERSALFASLTARFSLRLFPCFLSFPDRGVLSPIHRDYARPGFGM